MAPMRFPRLRFSLKSLFVLILGIAIGFSLNLWTLRLLTGPASEARMGTLPAYVIEPPDIVMVDVAGKSGPVSSVSGKHLVGPDGKVNLGTHGQVYLAGMTIEEAREAITKAVAPKIESPRVLVDVFAYNSKKYYMIVEGAGGVHNVLESPITGNETVLDAIARIGGIDSKNRQVYIARPADNGTGAEQILSVDWDRIARGESASNYQVLPGDRVYISQKAKSAATN